MSFPVILAALLLVTSTATAQEVTGRATVIDGDTIEIHGQRIRLFGIDAPEGGQQCEKDGKPWRCGKDSAFALDAAVSGKTVICRGVDRDRNDRLVAVCSVGNSELNAALVRDGWAMDYPKYSKGRYAAQQAEARAARRGLWAGTFTPPWEWRAAH